MNFLVLGFAGPGRLAAMVDGGSRRAGLKRCRCSGRTLRPGGDGYLCGTEGTGCEILREGSRDATACKCTYMRDAVGKGPPDAVPARPASGLLRDMLGPTACAFWSPAAPD